MPTFDFANVLRKLLSAAVATAASPVTAVLAGATLLSSFLDDILQFFNDDLTLPSISPYTIPTGYDSDLVNLLLYAINWDSCASFLSALLSYVVAFVNFGVKFVISTFAVLIAVGIYRVVRRQLLDVVG